MQTIELLPKLGRFVYEFDSFINYNEILRRIATEYYLVCIAGLNNLL